jgi:hypothetical protein
MKITEICEGNTSHSQPQKSHVNESLVSLTEHIKRQVPLCDSIFRYQSEAYFDTFKTAKKLREAGLLPELDWESEEMLGTDIGESVELKGVGRVWLDVPYLNEGHEPKQEIVDKFARTDAKTRTWYIDQWAEEKGIDSDDAMFMAGYVQDGYIGAGAWNWRYVGMGESVQEADDEVDTGPTWKDDLEDALDGYPEWAHEYIKDGVCPECGGNGYMDGDYENEDGEENDECSGMYNYDCDEGEIRDNTWADELKSKEPEAPKQPAPSKEEIMKILPRLHDDYVKSGRYNAFELGGILKQMYPELNKREAGSYVADFLSNFKESEELNDLRKRAGLEVKEAEYQGKKVELSKPKRGGSKKFYVYVTDPKTKNVKKVSFGADSGGGKLAVKLKDPKARKAFADRHNCDQKNDKTKAGYWSCRLPRYAKSLGLSGGGTWW